MRRGVFHLAPPCTALLSARVAQLRPMPTAVCPKGLNPGKAIAKIKQLVEHQGSA